jgi:ABC-type oligopeptide transport system, periplasmic component
LRYITGSEPQTLDPHVMTGQPESRIAAALFDGLVEYEEVTMAQRPSLAKSWKPNADGTVWTFYLRDDAKWTDNTRLTAHDFTYSWRRAVSPELAAPYASMMYIVKNAKAYNELMAFVRDPQTGKFATLGDVERAKGQQPIAFTGKEPERFDKPPAQTAEAQSAPPAEASESAPEDAKLKKYLFVPTDKKERETLLQKDAELARFMEGKELLPVQKEHMGVRALDDYTFEVTLESPTAYFIKLLYHQFFRPVPRQAIEKFSASSTEWVKPANIITCGAFKLEEWRPYERIVVVRNPIFWDNANTRLDKIIFPAVEQLTTAMNMYKSGEVDATQSNEVPPAWRNSFKETKKDYMYGPYLQVEALGIKTTLPPLNNVKVRQALSMAIDRQILADQAPGRMPTTSFVPQMEGYENAKVEGYNPEKARQFLAEAGFPGGKGFPELEILYNTAESNKQTQELIQQMWKKELGINIKLTNKEWRVYLEDTRARRLNFNGFARWAWIGDYVDPYTFLELVRSDSDNDRTAWRNVTYDKMLDAANRETDAPKRMKLLHDAEQYMMSQQPMIPLFIGPSSFLKKPYVKNLVPNLLDQHDWRQVYIDHGAISENRFFEPFGSRPGGVFAFLKY